MKLATEVLVPHGFKAGVTTAGLKPSGAADLALIVSELPAVGAGVFTTNRFAGANIALCREHLASGSVRAVVIHAGQANACTGKAGDAAALATARKAAEVLGVKVEEIVVGSTGVIGVLPAVEKISAGLEKIGTHGLSAGLFPELSKAIMTTDTKPKLASVRLKIGGKQVTLLGVAKGAGMINPSMGTMLGYVVTDAIIAKPLLKKALAQATESTFNCLTVDGDTSTSDMLVVMANGAAANAPIRAAGADLDKFTEALTAICQHLARAVAADGEGATRLVSVTVNNAKSFEDARLVAKAVASSSLVKCAIFGRDPNWGRIAAAVGYSGGTFDPAKVRIAIGKDLVFEKGQPALQDRMALSKYLMESPEVDISISLAAGKATATVWTCDFSLDYVRINAHYTT